MNAEEAFDEFRRQADREFRRQVRNNDLRRKLELVFTAESNIPNNQRILDCVNAKEFRCTVYISDILFEHTLYQLLDYYPKQTTGGAGRRFSIRYGIISRSWRLHEHDTEGYEKEPTPDDLIKSWGMTKEEAQTSIRQLPSYVCTILRDGGGLPIGILYLDSKAEKAFGTGKEGIAGS